MELLIADTFTDSLARLTNAEQKLAKTTAFDLHVNLASPGLQLERIDGAKDKNFWSIRAGLDLRIVIHRSGTSTLLCYVGHHDDAYDWAGRRKVVTHPATGAAQLVEIRETVQEIPVPKYVEVPTPAPPKKKLLAHVPESELLGYGVPPEWLADVREVADDDSLLALAQHLPGEAGEALLTLAYGGKPEVQTAPTGTAPFAHPDAQRRFRLMPNLEALQQALAAPWEKWTVFLHPAQRQMVERDYKGPARVSGSAGTGKTIVALHRAVHLARTNPDARVLLTTFSAPLANALRGKMVRLIGEEPRLGERIDVTTLEAVARRMFTALVGPAKIASADTMRTFLKSAGEDAPSHGFTLTFLTSEWADVIDSQQLGSWAMYREAKRPGRKSRLSEKQRAALWKVIEGVRTRLGASEQITLSELFNRLAEVVRERNVRPFEFIVVDEAQDLSMSQLRLLAALGGGTPNSLFFAGDIGQRIFQPPFSWKSIGIDVRGRSRTLTVNYRTSHQIRSQADRLLARELSDTDGNIEPRDKTVSLFDGPAPTFLIAKAHAEEEAAVSDWIKARISAGLRPTEIGVFVRSSEQLGRAKAALTTTGVPFDVLDERMDTKPERIALGTMHLAKGLEFPAVVVMACDDEVIPSQARIDAIADEGDLEEVYDTERHLLYVACTRARDRLLVTATTPASEFIKDMR